MDTDKQAAEQAAFRVVQMYPVTVWRERVLLETDDWLAAESFVQRKQRNTPITMAQDLPKIVGSHPTHRFERGTCQNDGCRVYDNGSYGSHAPCGTVFEKSLGALIDDWREHRLPPGVEPKR